MKTFFINSNSPSVVHKHGLFIIKDSFKLFQPIFISLAGKDVIVLGDIETTEALTVEVNSIRFEGKVVYGKGLTVYGLNLPPVSETEIFIK